MEPVVVSVEGVSKRYRIGGLHKGYDSFREVFVGAGQSNSSNLTSKGCCPSTWRY